MVTLSLIQEKMEDRLAIELKISGGTKNMFDNRREGFPVANAARYTGVCAVKGQIVKQGPPFELERIKDLRKL